jgi:hypothetical protein
MLSAPQLVAEHSQGQFENIWSQSSATSAVNLWTLASSVWLSIAVLGQFLGNWLQLRRSP